MSLAQSPPAEPVSRSEPAPIEPAPIEPPRVPDRGFPAFPRRAHVKDAALLWGSDKIAVLVLAWAAMWVLQGSANTPISWSALWEHWDATLFRDIAQYGYFGPPYSPIKNQAAFFPGYPLLLALVHAAVRSWTVAELLTALIASGFAALNLARLAEDYRPGSGARAVLCLLTAPAAVFLSVGYSESLFLAFALAAWLAGRRGYWARASFFTSLACLTRVSGLFVLAGLLCMALTDGRSYRVAATARLALSLIPVGIFELYLRIRTGDWLAWMHAEQQGWGRTFTDPPTSFQATWTAAFGHEFSGSVAFVFQLEIAAVAVGLALVVFLAYTRRWPELIYTASTMAAMVTSSWYESVPRALLLLWPLWCALGAWSLRRRAVLYVHLAVSGPLMAVTALLYLSGRWAA